MIDNGKIDYQIIGDEAHGYRVTFRNVPRPLFNAIPAKESSFVPDSNDFPTWYQKKMRRGGVEFWFQTTENHKGQIEGVNYLADVETELHEASWVTQLVAAATGASYE